MSTILLIFATAIIGIYYARLQGLQTLRSGLASLYQNKAPVYEIISGASIAVAAKSKGIKVNGIDLDENVVKKAVSGR